MDVLFGSLRGYRRGWLRGDLVAGLTVWAVLVPEALAYATIAGVSPVVGLYAAPPALLFYAMLGSSRHLVVGPGPEAAGHRQARRRLLRAGVGRDRPPRRGARADRRRRPRLAGRRAGAPPLDARGALGVLVFDTLPGLFIGIAASLLLLLYRASAPRVAQLGRVPGSVDQYGDVQRHPENQAPDGVVILRVGGGLFFANADGVRRRILAAAAMPGVHAIVLDGEAMPFVDLTAAQRLEEVGADFERRGIRLLLARDIGPVRDVMRRTGAEGDLARVHPTVREAVEVASNLVEAHT